MIKKILFFSLTLIFSIISLSCGNTRNEKLRRKLYLIGADSGLYHWNHQDTPVPLWTGGEVKKIIKLDYGTFLLTDKGIVFSSNLIHFETRNSGIRILTIKSIQSGKKTLIQHTQEIKDINVDPYDSATLVCSTKDGVYLSRNRALKWKYYKRPSYIPGIKSVAVYSKPDLNIIVAHPFRGTYVKNVTRKTKWKNLKKGLFNNFGGPEEVSDILIKTNHGRTDIYCANNFMPHLYLLDQKKNWWKTVLSTNNQDVQMMESLDLYSNTMIYVTEKGVFSQDLTQLQNSPLALDDINILIQDWNRLHLGPMLSLSLMNHRNHRLELDQLWMYDDADYDEITKKALNIRALYLPAGIMRSKSRRTKILALMKEIDMNGIVIDMKDDSGNLRFTPLDKDLLSMAKIWGPVDLKTMFKETKKQNIYLIARIVVFKDKHYYHYQSSKYAIKDKYTKKPWQGLKIKKEGGVKVTNRIPEFWVDPFSEQVWMYNVKIAQDLIKQGFDEVQFDYIRFPTDGINIYRTYYSHQEGQMDKSSALRSFLKYARENISAPISIDIYGGNGWNRSGTHTGQDVEMIKDYVNVICPMYYPSHFPQDFLRQDPAQLRTWRIYYYGTFRNWMIGHKKVTIRPYVQAFKINVSFDRKYYGVDYIKNEIKGIDDALGEGYIYWNAGGKYNILRKVYATNQ